MLNILYIGNSSIKSTSRHRADALVRMGNRVKLLDPYLEFNHALTRFPVRALHFRTGYRYLQRKVAAWLQKQMPHLQSTHFDLVWVDSGELLGSACLKLLKQYRAPLVLFNHDDPTGGRDRTRFSTLVGAAHLYDLCAVVRKESAAEFEQLGTRVLQVWRSYDEVHHAPVEMSAQEAEHYRSEVAFIGTWIPGEGRDEFMLGLKKRNLPIAIWGDRWHKSKNWSLLKDSHRGSSLSGRDYVMAIRSAKICLGFLSSGNRDLHTTRTMEIPYAGGLLCAQRTTEHEFLFRDGVDAVFWDSLDDCADKCEGLLRNETLRERIRKSGMERVRSLGLGHESICAQILAAATSLKSAS